MMPSACPPLDASVRRVLLVDDDPDGLELMAFLLEGNGFSVRCAETGIDGISIAVAWQPHALVIDLDLPDMTGDEVAARVRSLGLPIRMIALSGFGPAAQRARAEGLDAYLVKPVDVADLVRALDGTPEAAATV